MKPELKKLLILNAPYLLFVYLFDKIGQAVRLAPGADLSGKVLSLADGFSAAFATPLPSLAPMDLLIGIVGAVLIRLMVYFKGKNAKKYRKGIEYGSARWGNAEDIKPYTDPVFQNNVLLTQTERLTMNSRPKQPKYARNKNILVIGGSGSGKTRFFVKPNLMQMHSSYVVTDPKGTVLVECGKLLQRGGYRIKVLNTINFKKSMRYNPFAYIRSEKDILKLVNTLIANTKGDGEKAGEDFWVKSERLFYCALMTEDEIAVMDGGKCILQLRGVRPFFSDKYDITKHPNYKYLSDYDKKNTFDMEKHLRRRPALVKPDEVFDYYEISESDLQEDTDHE